MKVTKALRMTPSSCFFTEIRVELIMQVSN